MLDIFYKGLTDESRTYLDSCAGCVFRQRTPAEAEELMAKIRKNYDVRGEKLISPIFSFSRQHFGNAVKEQLLEKKRASFPKPINNVSCGKN